MKLKKVAIFTHGIKRGPFTRLGTTLARGFQEAGVDCDLVVLQATEEQKAKYPDINVISLKVKRAVFSCLPLIKYLQQQQPEIVFAMPSYFNIIAILAKYLSGVKTKIVIGEHNICSLETKIEHGDKLKIKYLPLLMRYIYPYGDGLIGVCADTLKDLVKEMKVAPEIPMQVISNPIDVTQIQQVAQEATDHPCFENPDCPVILTVARMAKQKRLDLLIRAFAKVRETIPAQLLILGDGSLKEELEHLCQELQVHNYVFMPGYDPNPYKYMSACDVFVLYSAWEGCPVALEEAIACGAAVVVNDAPGGSKEVVDNGQYGMVVPHDNPEALAIAIAKIINNPQIKQHYQQKALIRAKEFQYQKISQQYLDFAISLK